MDATNITSNLPSINPTVDKVRDKAIDFAFENGPKILAAIIIVIVGWIVAKWIDRMILRALNKKDLEPPIKMLITRVANVMVLGFTLVIALATAGVNVLALVAGVSVVGVGVGLAMQGVLSNLVAGLSIIFTKPFRVGEYVELAGVQGQVKHIDLFATTLLHNDLSRVVVPNRKIVGEILHNYGGIRQLDLSFSIAYGSDVTGALAVVDEILAGNKRVLKEPGAVVGVGTLGDGSIGIAVKPWTSIGDAGPAGAEINQAIADRIRANKISLPVPHRDVRLLNSPPAGPHS
jgi:small conductance mechanosensitive channel